MDDKDAVLSTYIPERRVYLGYDLLLLPVAHVLCVLDPTHQRCCYVSCTPSEYSILVRLLAAPLETIVPFQALLPQHHRTPGEPPLALQRHMSRLKRKLPAGWSIACEPGSGYRLLVCPITYPEAQDAVNLSL